jgi:hypothetical protein
MKTFIAFFLLVDWTRKDGEGEILGGERQGEDQIKEA